ncbi:hypothetical protein DENIS_3530 [Desulfonema ishimotonii]|uniref:Sigma-54-dependent Fis family transcriptional re gulator n=1 Tax=Desulfonema ishimotonii TaxID=45657 RepID=A0A401G017_9BACT|nr:sigma 54-interacting transcriptional regulator [Desulfonema ishimotonii]GBC62558.1 hypothetical protein DENIS_3530 [Desulfonema ishimotonii]
MSEDFTLYKDLFEYAPIGILRSTPDGRLTDVNPTLARMLGYESAEESIASIKNTISDLYVDPSHREQLIRMTLKQDHLLNFESRFYRKDGSAMDCLIHVRIARGKDGSVKYLEGFIQDISEQKLISKALTESETRYRSVFENTGSATVIVEQDMTILLANTGFQKLTGYSKEEIEGRMKWPAIIAYPKDLERMMAYHFKRRKFSENVPLEYEFILSDRQGNRKNVFVRVDMIAGTECSVASILDISSLKKARRSLRESESKLVGIVEAFEGFIYVCSANYRISFMNRALKQFIGKDKTGDLCYQAIYRLNSPCDWCGKKQVLAGETVKTEFRRPVDKRWCYAVSSPVFDIDESVMGQQTVIIDIHERKQAELATKEKDAFLRKENMRLRSALKDSHHFSNIIGKSLAMRQVYEMVLRSSATDANVIIYGESGTGKELVARAIHDMSERSGKRFVPVNCGAIPRELMESEFFGYRKGGFTGADRDKPGFFDQAAGGTLFLDELGEISEEMQVKLLRVLEGGGYIPIGGLESCKPDARIIAATNRNFAELVRQGRIREDFFYRIHIIPIYMPPLCERREDIPLLADHFLKKYDPSGLAKFGSHELNLLHNHDWPGNVRELENTVQRYLSLNSLDFPGDQCRCRPVIPAPLPDIGQDARGQLQDTVRNYEKKYIAEILEQCQWNRTKAAALLGIGRKTLYLKIKHLGIRQHS